MNFHNLVKQRYSVRDYSPEPIDPQKLEHVLEAARLAPTAANRQPFQLIVIHTEGIKEELYRIYDRDWFVNAPIVICACGLPKQGWVRVDGKSYIDVDIAIVMDHISLAAADLDLGTCWVASFDVEAAREILRIPEEAEPIIFMSLGHPRGVVGDKERKSLNELVSYDKWK
jgi:nitroreductase